MGSTCNTVKVPSKLMMILEARVLLEASVLIILKPLMGLIPRGDNHPVLIFPGFGTGDWATALLRKFLKKKGYAVHGWNLGMNLGYRKNLENQLEKQLLEISKRYNRKVSLIGWSLGGVYARELAKAHPEHVRFVITLGSPFLKIKEGVRTRKLYELISGHRLDDMEPGMASQMQKPPPVPTTSIFSSSDGLVARQCCIQKETRTSENIRIPGCSHVGLVSNPLVYWVIANRLAQPEKNWRHYNRKEMKKAIRAKSFDEGYLAA